jgi:hypothetical protein
MTQIGRALQQLGAFPLVQNVFLRNGPKLSSARRCLGGRLHEPLRAEDRSGTADKRERRANV